MREGFAKAPNRRSRVLLNSVMNHAGKKGSYYGNTFAVLGELPCCISFVDTITSSYFVFSTRNSIRLGKKVECQRQRNTSVGHPPWEDRSRFRLGRQE